MWTGDRLSLNKCFNFICLTKKKCLMSEDFLNNIFLSINDGQKDEC